MRKPTFLPMVLPCYKIIISFNTGLKNLLEVLGGVYELSDVLLNLLR